ncbi:hypothetical protein T484DRAFT_1770346 [Baffinella frigidus]|nr:hypothetical protein T484DRAFT_1770346 [Cryptophyta sp. CCMP2293]
MGQIAYVFFILYYAGCNFIMLPLFVATLIDYFFESQRGMLPLFVATLIDYFFESQVDVQSLFNADACELYSLTWSEFDDSGSGYTNIDNLRPLMERLADNGSDVGFRVSADMNRFRSIWARVMTNPLFFPTQGLTVSEDEGDMERLGLREGDVERLGLRVIDRNNILKAFGNSARAIAIRQYVYKKTDIKEKREVSFKCMVIFMPGLQKPLTSADLVNRGAGLQSFMGLLGLHEVQGREGKENDRWRALEVHNELANPVDAKKHAFDDGEDHSDFDVKELAKIVQSANRTELAKIVQAQGIVRKELRPVAIPGETVLKPTGDKREALVNKINSMQEDFEEMAEGLIGEIMWGTSDNPGIVDVLLDKIIDRSVQAFAHSAVGSIAQRFDQGERAKVKVPRVLYVAKVPYGLQAKVPRVLRYSTAMLETKTVEPVVTTVPRGWLNSQRPVVRKRLKVGAVLHDTTPDTLAALSRLAPRPPRPPSRAESLQSTGEDAGVRKALDGAMLEIRREDAWQQATAHDFPAQNDLY